MKKRAIAEKIAEATHTSTRDAMYKSLPYLQVAFKKNKEFREKLTEELELSREESEWLRK